MDIDVGHCQWVPKRELEDGDLFVFEHNDAIAIGFAATIPDPDDDGDEVVLVLEGDGPSPRLRNRPDIQSQFVGRVREPVFFLGGAGLTLPIPGGKMGNGDVAVASDGAVAMMVNQGGTSLWVDLKTGRVEMTPPPRSAPFNCWRIGYRDGDTLIVLSERAKPEG